ncbi:bifunctional 3-(3-hydroxy-phenyl)propionate/3-hydroxycinnamic acid hydroxylase [Arthrobacter sp. NPDC080031]|uniref:bifunctional 3-(3-hydroxy-phenyl)propionate/3-hydroxycinnamic acid hydroxylase n=1 Tax=Arthrobacter sp. NPDC080031 TaxID=3155918 RepID=UPI00344D582B
MKPHKPLRDVAIVGAGPVGSALATLLACQGLHVLLIEQSETVFALPRAAHIDHMGLRTLQQIGLLDELLPGMIPNPGLEFRSGDGVPLMRIPGDQGSISGLPASMYFHQPTLDTALRRRALEHPNISARIPARLVSIEQSDEGVVLGLEGEGGVSMTEQARWLVGCDGASSTVRESAGLELQSYDFDEHWLVVDLNLPESIDCLPSHAVHVCDPARPHTAIPMPGNRYRFELQLRADEDPVEVQQPASVAHLLSDWLDISQVDVERAATYTFHGLVARSWRRGRVLIAGDAAHQMPPFLGQGMCSGLRDAVNLAWKLALVVRENLTGPAADALLDSYVEERREHVAAITTAVVDFGAVISTQDVDKARARDEAYAVDPRPIEQRMPFSLPHLAPGRLVLEGGGRLFGQAAAEPDEPRLDDLIGSRFLVVAASEADIPDRDWWQDVAGAHVAVVGDGLADAFFESALARANAHVIVVRPDRYVLSSGASAESARDTLEGILSRADLAEV